MKRQGPGLDERVHVVQSQTLTAEQPNDEEIANDVTMNQYPAHDQQEPEHAAETDEDGTERRRQQQIRVQTRDEP